MHVMTHVCRPSLKHLYQRHCHFIPPTITGTSRHASNICMCKGITASKVQPLCWSLRAHNQIHALMICYYSRAIHGAPLDHHSRSHLHIFCWFMQSQVIVHFCPCLLSSVAHRMPTTVLNPMSLPLLLHIGGVPAHAHGHAVRPCCRTVSGSVCACTVCPAVITLNRHVPRL